MKDTSQRNQILMAASVVALTLLMAWGYAQFTASRSEAIASAEDLEICRRLAHELQALKAKPLRAALEARSSTEVAGRIEAAAKTANLPISSVIQIDPQSPRRVGNTPYKEQPTHVELRDVTLKQLLVFVHTLASDELKLDLAEVRLSAPRDEPSAAPTEERWMAELALTHLIFAP